jgi:glyoxylase-like metal-dependent hydrolase (beta-lactamase superfamily II)
MDGGPEGLSIERNVKAMALDLKELDAIVLSHWHRDREPNNNSLKQPLISQILEVS